MRSKTSERGFALPTAIFALVIVSVLAVSGFYVARQELRVGVASARTGKAFNIANSGIVTVPHAYRTYGLDTLQIGSRATVSDTTAQGSWSVEAERLSSFLYFMDGTGGSLGAALLPAASRRVGVIARLNTASLPQLAALTTRGTTRLSGNTVVKGDDEDPKEWDAKKTGVCSGALTDKPGVMGDDSTAVTTTGSVELSGAPPLAEDSTISAETFTQFGDVSWDQMIAMADKILPGGTYNETAPSFVGGLCDRSDPMNWGDPLDPFSACGSYFPLIHIQGSAKMQAKGVGQGILLVDGDFEVRGGFVFYGLVIAKGTLRATGTGNKVTGAVLAGNIDLENNLVAGDSRISFSSCVIDRLQANMPGSLRPLERRSWMDLSSVIQ